MVHEPLSTLAETEERSVIERGIEARSSQLPAAGPSDSTLRGGI